MIPLVVVGAAGRMGRAVEQAALADGGFRLKGLVDRTENFRDRDGVWSEDAGTLLSAGDVVIEFSAPDVCAAVARLCAGRGAALVSGTTGLSAEEEETVRAASLKVAVVRAANFSLGVATLRRALEAALAGLPAGWDIEIVERHHRGKVDSPSGTALALARVAQAFRGSSGTLKHGREGRVGRRQPGEIGVHAVRGGTWVGDHAVLLAGEGEWLELRHVAQDRGAFAHGAIAAARFVADAGPGLYNLDDVMGVKGRPA